MTSRTQSRGDRRRGLDRAGVVAAAVSMADDGGIDTVTMRRLGDALGVEAMSLYNHVANKEDLLDAMVDQVFSEIDLPRPSADWRTEMVRRADSMRSVLAKHRWAVSLMESRTSPGPATLRHHDATLDSLRSGGFSLEMTAHAVALLDSYVYGFALQEASLPFEDREGTEEVTGAILAEIPAEEFPRLSEMATQHVLGTHYLFADEFPFGLALILDGLAERLD